jgi:ribosomal protein L12E/L44/L45/RPP1/RPP2
MNTCTCEEFENININAWRNGYKWTINECLRLEREYDLLKLSVPEMAILHKRTMNAIMCKLQAEELDTFNNLYIKTYGEDHIDDQINKLNNLSSAEDDEDEDEEDEDEDDEENEDEEDEDKEDEEDEEDEGSKHAYMFEQVKRIHKHISNLLNYFTNTKESVKKSPGLNC